MDFPGKNNATNTNGAPTEKYNKLGSPATEPLVPAPSDLFSHSITQLTKCLFHTLVHTGTKKSATIILFFPLPISKHL